VHSLHARRPSVQRYFRKLPVRFEQYSAEEKRPLALFRGESRNRNRLAAGESDCVRGQGRVFHPALDKGL